MGCALAGLQEVQGNRGVYGHRALVMHQLRSDAACSCVHSSSREHFHTKKSPVHAVLLIRCVKTQVERLWVCAGQGWAGRAASCTPLPAPTAPCFSPAVQQIVHLRTSKCKETLLSIL